MTTEEKLNEILTVYDKVKILSDNNGCKVIKLRHKQLKTELVLHILPGDNSVYETLCDIRHPNLPAVYDCYSCSDGMLILEEYVDGLTVAEVAESGKYDIKGAVTIIKSVCSALSALHGQGIIHRDIKPENILITNDGRVRLIDFNAARKMSIKSRDTVIMGTVGYASPEQLGLFQTDPRTDIYALGVLLNVMVTGVHPAEKIAPGHIGRVVKKCTSINPDNRYQTVEKFAMAL